MRRKRLNCFLVFVSFTALLLASCGGGGGEDNTARVADAGPDQNVLVGEVVTIDGSGSGGTAGGNTLTGSWMLTYNWAFTSKPAGSSATLAGEATVNPTFTADQAGAYTVQLTVNDGTVTRATDSVTITATDNVTNTAPVADAGPDQTVTLDTTTIFLDGSGSYDVDDDNLTYEWHFLEKPLLGPAPNVLFFWVDEKPSFTPFPGVAGIYTIQLIVNDGTVASLADTVVVNVVAADLTAPNFINGDPTGSIITVCSITAEFDDPILASTITDQTFIVHGINATDPLSSGDGTWGLSPSSDTIAVFTPSIYLVGSYNVTLTTAITNTAGINLAENQSWTFTAAIPCPPL